MTIIKNGTYNIKCPQCEACRTDLDYPIILYVSGMVFFDWLFNGTDNCQTFKCMRCGCVFNEDD